ncbi:STAS domain-containing protein [Gynuella sunshinyii]|nr:STAS domain-containing protein [Gynuella sunshinyii]
MVGRILVAEHCGTWVLKLVGDVRMTLCNTIEDCLSRMYTDASFRSVVVDLTETECIDSTSLGLLAKISIKTKQRIGHIPTLISTNDDVTRILLSMGFKDQVFVIAASYQQEDYHLAEVSPVECTEKSAEQRVIEAHKILMDLNDHNRSQFKDLVYALEHSHH